MNKGLKICVASALVAVIGGAAGFMAWKMSDPHRLVADKEVETVTDSLCGLNQNQYFGFAGWGARGGDPVSFTSAKLVGVQDGLTVKGFYAVSMAEYPDKPILLTGNDDQWQRNEAGVKLHPVSDVVLDPHSADTQWWLVAVVQQTRPGPVRATGLSVDYSAGGRSGSTKYNFVSVSDCKSEH